MGRCSQCRRPEGDSNTKSEACLICLEPLDCVCRNPAQTLSNCGHRFHKACLQKWLEANSTCPHCRASCLRTERPHFVVVTEITERGRVYWWSGRDVHAARPDVQWGLPPLDTDPLFVQGRTWTDYAAQQAVDLQVSTVAVAAEAFQSVVHGYAGLSGGSARIISGPNDPALEGFA